MAAIKTKHLLKGFTLVLMSIFTVSLSVAQTSDSVKVYKKRVLETTEIDFLSSYYSQDGNNAAVNGGIGDEALKDVTSAIVVSIPLNEDDVLTIDAGISAYSSASSSNINPFDNRNADPFVASSGESSRDVWSNATGTYSHSSDDRNTIWSSKVSFSSEYDYTSFGFGGSYTRLMNKKNTELSVHANVYTDKWRLIYPVELRPTGSGGGDDDEEPFDINRYTITGNVNYNPLFTPHDSNRRNSYAVGLGFSQILSKSIQGMLLFDVTSQQGLLSTPFQRVYFEDIGDSFIENYHLADDIERLPDSRLKIATGARLNIYLNEYVVVRSYYRYYFDDWNITSHTMLLELPIKLTDKFTFYPSYRFYNQSAADYFSPYNQHISTDSYYTSDFDLSEYNASQIGLGLTYTDIFTDFHVWHLGLKSVDLKYHNYTRSSGLTANIISLGVKLSLD